LRSVFCAGSRIVPFWMRSVAISFVEKENGDREGAKGAKADAKEFKIDLLLVGYRLLISPR
jgi:hypothetical protein